MKSMSRQVVDGWQRINPCWSTRIEGMMVMRFPAVSRAVALRVMRVSRSEWA